MAGKPVQRQRHIPDRTKPIATPEAAKEHAAARGLSTPADSIPRSFVISKGHLTKTAAQLLLDLRRIMEPNTATKLRQRRANKTRDFVSMAGPLGVTHMLMLSQSALGTVGLRMSRLPQGPTLHFAVQAYTLAHEIAAFAAATRRRAAVRTPCAADYAVAPLLVLNNFPVERSEGRLMCSMIQNMFPAISTSTMHLSEVRRIVLFSYEQRAADDAADDTDPDADIHGSGVVHVRQYVVGVKHVGLSKTVKRIVRAEIPDLGRFADAADFVLQNEALMSDSEVEPDSLVPYEDAKKGRRSTAPGTASSTAQQKAVSLVECGPRMTLRLMKVTEGLHTGRILYHHLSMREDAARGE